MSGSWFCDTFCVSHCHWDVETTSYRTRALNPPITRSVKIWSELCQYLSLNIFISENVTTSVILYACHSIPVYGAYLENLLQIHVIPAKQTNDALGPCISTALCNGLFFASFIRFYKDSSTGDQRLMDNPDIIRPFNGYYTTRLVTKFHDN